jgi:hypothetical protein
MATPTKAKGVRTTHPDYDRMSPTWRKCRDFVAGQLAIHNAGTAYIPKLKDETDVDYQARLKRSDFFNGTWITIRAFIGMLFRKSPTKEVPASIEAHLADVTMTGKEDEAFAKALAHEALTVTRFGLLVDHPPAPKLPEKVSLTVHAKEAMGLRPKLALYAAETVSNWRPQDVGKPGQYAMVTLVEQHPIPEDEFSHNVETRYRVLDLDAGGLYRQRLFRIDDKGKDEQVGDDIYPLMNGKPLNYVPFKTYGADGEEVEVEDPALIDLVNTNEAVYQINSDYRHGLHFTGLPTAVVSGYQPANEGEKLYIGSQAAWIFPDPQAKASFLEFTGQGLEALRLALVEKKQEMAMAGARAIADETRQAETLGATQIKRNGENSALSNVAISVSSALEWGIGVFAEWAGQAGPVVYQLNRDFNPMGLDAQQLTALVGAVQAGKLTDEEFFDLCQRGDLIKADVTFEEHQAQVDSSGPPKPVVKPGQAGVAA